MRISNHCDFFDAVDFWRLSATIRGMLHCILDTLLPCRVATTTRATQRDDWCAYFGRYTAGTTDGLLRRCPGPVTGAVPRARRGSEPSLQGRVGVIWTCPALGMSVATVGITPVFYGPISPAASAADVHQIGPEPRRWDSDAPHIATSG